MPDLTIANTPIPNGFRVSLKGDAGGADIDLLDAEFKRIVAASPALVLIDLSELRYISSSGMGLLLALRSVVGKKNGVLRLGGAIPEIAEAFKRAKLDMVLNFVDSV